jgi:hypothetical protein
MINDSQRCTEHKVPYLLTYYWQFNLIKMIVISDKLVRRDLAWVE